ncbi:hypothetical protein BWI93_08500 [Siphonobacter sp. BAB-5385]|uniref:glycosyltransferase family 2 protein n=1 Tax=unclassified Siphonobacter TaxID=2635712 RepID=UPI000B9E94FF|nr:MULTISPECIES: glycosyltransferase [unclassified Siphonobacter]OZI08573.1 hypothetical protein BWI93_08500 [Siphonobacter sp. BAB-5385]PMD90720.1 hypothetical protein BWI97_22320 [Siphonobacter sp. BAB-5405]
MEKVSIVIPVYGQWNLVKRNIDALLWFDSTFIKEIILVDDCSPEPCPFAIDASTVRLMRNINNLGYAGTVNQGLRWASSEIIVLLDSDAYPTGPFVETLLSMYRQDRSIGCIGFGTVDDLGNSTGNYHYEPSAIGLIAGQLLQSKLSFLRFWKNKAKMPFSCAVSFRKACLEEMSYFNDRDFPVLESDIDLNLRIYKSAWKLYFTHEIIMVHKGGNSYKVNSKRVQMYHESRWKLLRRHGIIHAPLLNKDLLKTRINLEILLLNILTRSKTRSEKFKENLRGRKELLKAVNQYN